LLGSSSHSAGGRDPCVGGVKWGGVLRLLMIINTCHKKISNSSKKFGHGKKLGTAPNHSMIIQWRDKVLLKNTVQIM
jgi:hypothetical protein